jgi:hypothetical protein
MATSRMTANIDSHQIQQLIEASNSRGAPKEQVIAEIGKLNFKKVPATVSDTAKLARPGY